MANLLSALHSATGALRAFQDGITVSQNNVNNASTPGYAKQRPTLEALPANIVDGGTGGVRSGLPEGSRDPLAEQQVRRQLSGLGAYSARAETLSAIEMLLPLAGSGSIPGAITEFSNASSALSVTPNDATARERLVDSANVLAQSFQATATELQSLRRDLDTDIAQRVETINEIGARVRDYNRQILKNPNPDPGLEAHLYADLEALAELADVNAILHDDGTVDVLLGGQFGLVVGDRFQAISAQFSPSGAVIIASDGQDITSRLTRGRLGGALKARNEDISFLIGNGTQPGALNDMARHFADRVNSLLTSGMVDSTTPGVPMFTYTPGDEARTIAVSPGFTASQIATIDPNPPGSSNGIALAIAELPSSSVPADQVNGLSLLDFYGSFTSDIGRRAANARNGESFGTTLANQARSLRDERSSVSMDEEATRLVELQSNYQAAAQTVTVVDELIQTALSILRR